MLTLFRLALNVASAVIELARDGAPRDDARHVDEDDRPLGLLVQGFEPIAWSFVQSFNPAYACRASTCEDAIVDTITTGGALFTPQCYIELIRLSDPRGGPAGLGAGDLNEDAQRFGKGRTIHGGLKGRLLARKPRGLLD